MKTHPYSTANRQPLPHSKPERGLSITAAAGLFILLTHCPARAQGFQWTQKYSGSWPIIAIASSTATPATVLAESQFNIYRSLNAGTAWTSVSPSASFPGSSFAFDPSNPGIVYSGRSHGIMKSSDGGANWFNLSDLNAGPGASAIVIDPLTTNIVYAGISAGWGIYKSSNSGITWSNPLSGRDVLALVINPVNTSILYAGTKTYSSQPGGVLKSTDGGLSWTMAWNNEQVNALALNPGNPAEIYAGTETAGVFKSVNGGQTWAQAGAALVNIPVTAMIVDPGNPSFLYVATRGAGVYQSSDAGASWSGMNTGLVDQNCLCLTLDAPSHALYVGTYSGRVYRGEPPPGPEIAVQQPVNTDIPDGGGRSMAAAPGEAASLTFTILNSGLGSLTGLTISLSGPDSASFSIPSTPSAPVSGPTGSTSFTVRFSPAGVGMRTATLHIASNDADENPFDVALTGRGLSPVEDTDGDGLNDAAEYRWASLGFDWQVNQAGLVNTLFMHSNTAGLFTTSQIGALRPEATLLTADPLSGLFKLTIGVEQSTDLTRFTPFPMSQPQTTLNAQGKLEFQFSAPDSTRAFFRLVSP